MHKAGARLNPFEDGSVHDLKSWIQRGKLKGPWSVRYGEDGRPRWMKRVLPELRPVAEAAAEGVESEEEEEEEEGKEVEAGN